MKSECHLEKGIYNCYILESDACIAITETVTCVLQQKQLSAAESTTCTIATETPTCINAIKVVIHIFNAETVTIA